MTGCLAVLFVTGIELNGMQRFLLMLPICLSIAVVYKATRCERLRDIPKASLVLWISIVAGMYSVGLGLWAIYTVVV